MMKKPLVLCILDGYGNNAVTEGNAIYAAKTPNMDALLESCPTTAIGASGMDVGLPDGQMGNSEVGHTNIGAGRVVYQELTRITTFACTAAGLSTTKHGGISSVPELAQVLEKMQ